MRRDLLLESAPARSTLQSTFWRVGPVFKQSFSEGLPWSLICWWHHDRWGRYGWSSVWVKMSCNIRVAKVELHWMYQNWKQISSWKMMARHMLRNSCGWNLMEQSYSGSLGIRCLVKFISPQKTKKKKKKRKDENTFCRHFVCTVTLICHHSFVRSILSPYLKFQQLLPKVWILSKTILDNCFFEVREYFK